MKLFLKIIGVLMVGFLIIALILYFNGINHVDFDERYYAFMLDANQKLSKWAWFTIPKVPSVPYLDATNNGLYTLINFFSWLLNAIVSLWNFVITLLDTILDVLKFLLALMVVFFEDIPMIFRSRGSSSSSSSQVSSSSMMFPII